MVYFTAVETKTLQPQEIPDPGSGLNESQFTSSSAIADGFITGHERLLAEAEISRRIGQIEAIFIALGRFHELMAIYRDDFEKRGAASHVADRYAWGLVRLEHQKLAREVLDTLVAARPDDARVHFLDGAYYLKEQPPPLEDFPKIVAAWKRLLEVDPEFSGFDGVDAAFVRQQVARFEAQIPATAAATDVVAVEEVAEPEETVDVPEVVEAVEVAEVAEVSEVAEAAEVAEVAEPAEVEEPITMSKEQRVQLLVARGEIALSQGNIRIAEENFIRAKALLPDDFSATLGHLKAGWETQSARNKVATETRQLAEREDLTADQRLKLGTFMWAKLGRADLAKVQWQRAEAQDASLAPQVEQLLKRLK